MSANVEKKESDVNKEDLQFMLKAKNVYEELGSRTDCQALIDGSPKLLNEWEAEARLHRIDGKLKKCKIYVFDKYFIIGSERLRKRKKGGTEGLEENTGMTTASSSGDVVWFGSNKPSSTGVKQEDQNSVNKRSSKNTYVGYYEEEEDSDFSYYDPDLDEDIRLEEELVKKNRRYNLKMWIDLRRIKARITRSGSTYGILITYVSKVQEQIGDGEYRMNTIVDQAELWLDDEQKAKNILGTVQEAVNAHAKFILDNAGKDPEYDSSQKKLTLQSTGTDTDTLTETEVSSTGSEDESKKTTTLRKKNSRSKRQSSGASTGSGRKRKFVRGKQALRTTAAFFSQTGEKFDENGKPLHKNVMSLDDISDRYRMFREDIRSDQQGVADHDEGLEATFTVNFKNANLGFALSSASSIGPYVCRIINGGLAEASGVTLGDRIVAINDTEITQDVKWQACVSVISQEKGKGYLKITFVRRQQNELRRLDKEEKAKQLEEEKRLRKQKLLESSRSLSEPDTDGTVEVVDESEVVAFGESSKDRRLESIELRRKTDDGSNVPKFTLRRKTNRKRNFKKKFDIIQGMKHQITNMKEYRDFKENKQKMFDLYGNIDSLFETMLGYLKTDEERVCVRALKEIYDTEYQYNKNLNNLRRFHFELSNARKNVRCKNLKSSKPFCEHKRPRRYCTQESSQRELAIEEKDLNSLFLNVKPIMKSNVYLWKNLQKKLGTLYDKLANEQEVKVHEILAVFCSCFTEIAPFLQIYWQYCQRYTIACEKQRDLRANNPYFLKVCKPIEKSIKTKLPNLLSKPVQRITKYHLLFTTLKKYAEKYVKKQKKSSITEETREAFGKTMAELDVACDQLMKIALKVNRKVGEAENLDNMLEAFDEIGGKDGYEDLLKPHRRFNMKQAVYYENVDKDEKEYEGMIYFFNDIIALASVRSARSASVYNGNSKFSYPLRALQKMSLGNGRSTSISGKKAKKLSLMSGSNVSPKDGKKKSTGRATKAVNNLKDTKHSPKKDTKKNSIPTDDSKGSKKEDVKYKFIMSIYLKKVTKISTRMKNEEDIDFYGVDCYYSRKLETGGEEHAQLIFWFDTEEKRDNVKKLLEDLKAEDKVKREEMEKIRAKMLGPKKKRRFKAKRDKYKKQSDMSKDGKSKSSIYSKKSIREATSAKKAL